MYGFCYYHYWFKGQKLLERPLERMLDSGKPDFPFCLSWANESWTRKWDGSSHEVIKKQEYGDETEWDEHFAYLLTAFQDPRYIRIDNKPIFLIYRPGSIPSCERRLAYWNRLAQGHGLEGIYFVRMLGGFPLPVQSGFDASVEFEPHYTFGHSGSKRLWTTIKTNDNEDHLVFNYDEAWRHILSRSHKREGETVFPGVFTGWDNTPRLGARGQSCFGASADKFGWYVKQQLERAKSLYQSEYIFINAWNEWGEGAYLEPDQHHGFRYLEALAQALQVANHNSD